LNKAFKEGYNIPKEQLKEIFEVWEVFLTSDTNKQVKISRRGQNNFYSYNFEEWIYDEELQKWFTLKQNITTREYYKFLETWIDTSRNQVDKIR